MLAYRSGSARNRSRQLVEQNTNTRPSCSTRIPPSAATVIPHTGSTIAPVVSIRVACPAMHLLYPQGVLTAFGLPG